MMLLSATKNMALMVRTSKEYVYAPLHEVAHSLKQLKGKWWLEKDMTFTFFMILYLVYINRLI